MWCEIVGWESFTRCSMSPAQSPVSLPIEHPPFSLSAHRMRRREGSAIACKKRSKSGVGWVIGLANDDDELRYFRTLLFLNNRIVSIVDQTRPHPFCLFQFNIRPDLNVKKLVGRRVGSNEGGILFLLQRFNQ